ncbi:MAG: ferrous iron transporter B [Deltaproteobacteria bacterium]|nr:ferrous iron transporter B [Deltaproteobacteria bacterium]
MKILLMGNPNVGKSVVFNRLTGADVIASNYPGTTVEFTRGHIKIKEQIAEIIDVPGTYTLEPTCDAEEIAVEMLEKGADKIINVVDSTNLERSLNLTLQLIKRKIPMILDLNIYDEAVHKGISIAVEKLEHMLGLPCVTTCAVTGEGIKGLVDRLDDAAVSDLNYVDNDKWKKIGDIISSVQTITHRHHTFIEKLSDASVRPFTGIQIAIVVMLLAFFIIRIIGETLIGYVLEPIFEKLWAPLMLKFSDIMGQQGFLHDLLIGKLINGEIDFGQSFGLMTTGLFVPIASVLPYVVAFYLVLSFLEDSGYLPRMAVMVDTLFHRLGIHGLAIIPMMLGLGCNVPGVLSTRILETQRERFIAATLLSIAVPCMALQAMIVGLVGRSGVSGLIVVYITLFFVWVALGMLMDRFVKGRSLEIFTEIPPYRIPYLRGLIKKVWVRIKWFIMEAVPYVLLGVFIVNLLYTFGIIQYMGKIASPIVTGVLGLPEETVGALAIGFLRKDVAVGMLAPLDMTWKQLVIAAVVLTMYFPCIATFSTLVKELGVGNMIKSTAIMVTASLVVGGLLNLFL